jgi:hypothetical protein
LNINNFLITAIFGATFLISGCASKKIYTQNSGFFKSYEELNKSIKQKSFVAKSKNSNNLSLYKNIIITPVQVISSIPIEQQSKSQKKLYAAISKYLTHGYKKKLSKKFTIVEKPSQNTLTLQTAISAVEVHFDDEKWYQFSSTPLGLTAVSYNIYMDEDIRILGEKRLLDSKNGDILERSMNILSDDVVTTNGSNLEFDDIKPALDSWLEQIKIGL